MKCQKILLLLIYLCCLTNTHAQKQNFIMYRDSVSGRDTIIHKVFFKIKSPIKQQYSITTERNGETLNTYTAKEVLAYRDGNTVYLSKTIIVNGERRQVLLPRVYLRDSVGIYIFSTDSGKKEYYYQKKENQEKPLIPLQDNSLKDYKNPLKVYLDKFPIAQEDAKTKAYIQSMKPTLASFKSRYIVCRTSNPNYIPQFRWGVLGGIGISKLCYKPFKYGKKNQYFIGFFADLPLIRGLSFHPEVTYRQYAFEQQRDSPLEYDAVYNRKEFILPLMLRYTLVPLRGKILPYLQAGIELEYALKKESAYQYATTKDGFNVWHRSEPIAYKKSETANTIGIGAEYKIHPKHSLFIDFRYSKDTAKEYLTGYYIVFSYNL